MTRSSDGALRVAVVVAVATMFVAAFGVAARSTYNAQTSSDEPQYLLTALSLAEDLDLDISDEIDRRAFEPFHEVSLNTQTFPLNETGQRLSPHDPLLPAVAAPAMWIGGWVGVRLLLVAIGGLVAGLTAWTAVRRFGVTARGALVGVGSMMVGAPIAAYSTQVYPEILAAACVAAVVAAGTAPRLERTHVAIVLLAIIAMPWLAVKYAPVAAAATLAMGWRLRREARHGVAVLGVVVLAVAGVVYLVVHQRIYGGWTVYAAGDHFVVDGEFAVVGADPDYLARSRRLVGLLVDRRFGLVPWSPVWVVVPAALAAFLARRRPAPDAADSGPTSPDEQPGPPASVRSASGTHRADARLLVALPLAAGWATATFVALTMHGWWSPGRQVVVVVPLAALALAVFVDRRPLLRLVVAVLGVVGAVNWIWLALEASVDRRALIVDFYETAAPGYRLLAPLFSQGWPLTDRSDLVLAAWAVVVAASAAAGWRAERNDVRHGPGIGAVTDADDDQPAATTV